MIYGPTILFTIGEGAVLPVIPIIAHRMGADLALSALVAGMIVIGQLLGNIPSSWLVRRAGERMTMILAATVALAAVFGLVFARNLVLLSIAVLTIGVSTAAFGLARHAFMASRVSFTYRARALALLGGSYRLGIFIGPFVGAGLVSLTGNEHAVTWTFVIALVLVIALVTFGPDPEEAVAGRKPERQRGPGLLRTTVEHRGVLLRLGSAAAALSAVRSARQILLPVWGASIGLDTETILLVVGVSGSIDFALFYVSGQIMDRWGRMLAGVPSAIIIGVAFIALAFTHDADAAGTWFVILAIVLGVGNGLSSGILLTVGADLAPPEHPAAFLASWRTITDGGLASAPILISVITGTATLPVASAAMGAVGLFCAFGFFRWMPRYLKKP